MKPWSKVILLAALAMLAACAPKSSDEKQALPAPKETPMPGPGDGGQKDDQNDSGQTVGDCGEARIRRCALFGLSPAELLEIRSQIPQNVNSQLREKGFSESQIEQIRAARLVQWIEEQYPTARVTAKSVRSDDFFKFYNSIKW